jgi:protease I
MNFNETELRETQQALTDAGIMSSIASTRRGTITGASGGRARSEMLITQINPGQYGDGIIFIGGPGINEYLMNPFIGQLVNNTLNQGKVVGAISNATNILANSGVLSGHKVTGLATEQAFLERSGAQYTGWSNHNSDQFPGSQTIWQCFCGKSKSVFWIGREAN